jgi:hypothetical protein
MTGSFGGSSDAISVSFSRLRKASTLSRHHQILDTAGSSDNDSGGGETRKQSDVRYRSSGRNLAPLKYATLPI